jgi:hypothetical protein
VKLYEEDWDDIAESVKTLTDRPNIRRLDFTSHDGNEVLIYWAGTVLRIDIKPKP